jgi:hypothetical protein
VTKGKKKMGRPKTAPDTKVFVMRFELEVLKHLEEIASNQGGRTIASVIRQAVAEFLKRHPEREDFSDLLPASPKGKY